MAELPGRLPADSIAFFFSLTDSSGATRNAPVGAPHKLYTFGDRSGNGWVVLQRDPPERFTLSQNYPNPFNAQTRVELELPETGRVRLWIADARGRAVVTLNDRRLPAGRKSFLWNGCGADGERVPSGMYFFIAETPRETVVKKMVFVR
jgi:hypothetical protein